MSSFETKRKSLKADGVLVLVTLLAASGWMFSYQALRGIPPLLFVGIRFLGAGMILAALSGRKITSLHSDPRVLRQCSYTGLVLGAAMMSWIMGLHFTRALGAGAFISSLGVVIAPIVARFLFRSPVSRPTWMAIVVATLGLACLALQKGMTVHLADVFFFGSAIGFSVHFNLNSRFAGKIPVLTLTTIQLGIVGLLSLIGSALVESWPERIGYETWFWVALSVLIGTCLRFYFQIWAQSRTSMNHAAFIMTIEPVWAALFAMIWLGERMRPMQLLGGGLVLCALVISRWRSLCRSA